MCSNSCFVFLGRLLSRANLEKPGNENEKEENIVKSIFSKKRKIEVACSDCEVEVIPLELETHPRSAESENCSPKFSNNPKESIM